MQLTMSITLSHTYLLRAIEITEFSSYEQKRFFVTANAADLLDKSANPVHKHILPLEANLREPTDRNAGVHSILKSISANPSHEIASPIQVVCKSAKFATNSPKRLVLEFEDGQGVLDGSHRLYSLWKAQQQGMDLRDVRVNFMITVGDIDLIARCQELNTYTAPSKIALMNKTGLFDQIKEVYKDDFPFIRYYDGQTKVSNSNIMTVRAIDTLLLRSTGISCHTFRAEGATAIGSMGRNKISSSLAQGVREDLDFWRLLYDIHPLAVFAFQLLESEAIAGRIRHVKICDESKAIQLADGTRFNIRLQSSQLFYLLMSSLSVNFDEISYKEEGTYLWHIPLKTVGKQLIYSALKVYKTKSQQTGFQGSASYCMSKPELASAILLAAENKLAKYIDLNEAA